MWTISSVRSSLAPTGISVSARLLTGKMHLTTYEAEFPIWDRRSRILPLSRLGHNEFANQAGPRGNDDVRTHRIRSAGGRRAPIPFCRIQSLRRYSEHQKLRRHISSGMADS